MKATLELDDTEFERYKLAMGAFENAYNLVVPLEIEGYGGYKEKSKYGNFYVVNRDETIKSLINQIDEAHEKLRNRPIQEKHTYQQLPGSVQYETPIWNWIVMSALVLTILILIEIIR